MRAAQLKAVLPRELLASVVVFLVALPLCMGIAIASGMPPAKGLITGIIGGLVVGWLAGSPLQVSGPAAGLAVLVFELVRQHGVAMLGPILLLAGFLQLVAGRLRLGCWFRVTAPAVVYGMLAGIGVLIVLSQIHVMLDGVPKPSGLDNLSGFPAAVAQALPTLGGGLGWQAGLLGLSTILVMGLWEKFRPQALRFIPGALLGVGLATLASLALALNVKRVEVPANLAEAIDWLKPADLLNFADPNLLIAAFAVAFIASAETLLSAAAVDRMHSGERSDFDRELSAQGIGNMLCGLVGALPMTGVIVRSSANVQAGAKTRLSAIFHGVWLLAFVLLLSSVLQSIPVASLAGVLVYTGVKLVDLKAFRGLGRYGRMPMITYAVTALAIIFSDLLTGVLVGFGLTLAKLAWKASRLKISLIDLPAEGEMELRLMGAATFLKVPALTRVLGAIPAGATVHVPLNNLSYIDHSCLELLEEWGRANASKGSKLLIEARGLKRRLEGRLRTTVGVGSAG
ncbi:C4-dicarboxylic acid transporter DauA [Pseudomonas sp. FW306-02-F02-AA]|uniref:SulP family inorganic anion transporter n=1 Tax=Pseudomonas fluorescens TaxID=294 RepID=A0A0N9VT68_PSEFL|nr:MULTISPECIES: SulP family inorganic anion transporter [Pseudomonas]ALI01543.1 SulP family inorganic anion transporter [Pseudomonas fluorescens]PMZ05742.1 C4-dicarboxylic acid transporter DauA [Pseudomonas sp. FW306-02-F02-AB]PMZ11312.1 C4-dicarboxylic acid transporter DauA [Pseudomonas sp. FW306-02-H06C]PMZ17235.1 C4-dicarboxylic acid transporter DauA [Pseudomonas sp. FW306-02-F02-AA]PMZ22952.1 C4-dicarboxylic acid transporter DauA [Pseudomonas sp. FW306-02-F08-AA]